MNFLALWREFCRATSDMERLRIAHALEAALVAECEARRLGRVA